MLGKDGAVDRIVVPERLEAHRLIEEFMIQANVAAAETLEAKKSPLVYRIHDAPSLAKLEALREFLASIELSLPKGGNLRPSHFNRILDAGARLRARPARQRGGAAHPGAGRVQPGEHRPFRPQPAPLRAFHLADPPLCRPHRPSRADRARSSFGAGGLPDGIEDELPEIAAQISAAERRAMAAERDTVDRLIAHWLADRIGATFDGRISGVTRAGLFVKLDETGADGFVPMSTLGSDYFVYDEATPRRDRQRGPARCTASATASRCKLVEAAPLAGALRFELLSEGRVLPRSERPAARPPARRRPKAGETQPPAIAVERRKRKRVAASPRQVRWLIEGGRRSLSIDCCKASRSIRKSRPNGPSPPLPDRRARLRGRCGAASGAAARTAARATCFAPILKPVATCGRLRRGLHATSAPTMRRPTSPW